MIRIITAMANPEINKALKERKEFYLLTQDIQYKEGILEILLQKQNIDYLILNELLPGKIELKELINQITQISKNIKIIIFLENNKEKLEEFLIKNNVVKIFYNNEININKIIEFIKNDKEISENELKKEIQELKEIVLKSNKIKENSIFSNFYCKKEQNKKKNEIISILGTSGIGKSLITINLAKVFEKTKKILIIDFDILNSNIHTILGINKYSKKVKKKINENNTEIIKTSDLIIKINQKIDLISGIDILIENNWSKTEQKINEIINLFRKKYDLILVDTSHECFFEYNKKLMQESDICLFISGSNLLEIKKSKNILDMYIYQWKIKKEKIKILLNKYNYHSIDISLLKIIFQPFEIIGKIKYSKKYDLIINKNMKTKLLNRNIKKEYKIIRNNLEKNKVKKRYFFNKIKNNFNQLKSEK